MVITPSAGFSTARQIGDKPPWGINPLPNKRATAMPKHKNGTRPPLNHIMDKFSPPYTLIHLFFPNLAKISEKQNLKENLSIIFPRYKT
jgi:hypothetical protein